MSLALSTCVLFISLTPSVNGTQLLSVAYLLILFAVALATALFANDIVSLTNMYGSL